MSRQEDDMQREDHSDQEYQPSDIPDEVLARFRARVLCPTDAVPAADHRPVGSTVYRGTGRLPVRLLGRPPFERRQLGSAPPRRPVVAVLDTPLGAHPWLPSTTNNPGNYVVDQTVLTVPGTSGPPPIGPTEPLTGQL